MNSNEIRQRFLAFFEKRGHAILPSAPLVPENDPSTLFNTAGMQPLVPYLMGDRHPKGTRLANVQKCVRTQDIEEVGDRTHDTFFEMLGNWSLGDYFKEDAIKWSYELLTSKEEGFGLDPHRLYVTVFEGNEDAPRDEQSFAIWRSLGVPEHRIYFMPAKSNWWSPGDNGPCGPDTEMFYDITAEGLGDLTKEEYIAADDKQQVVEIWNDVFMEFEKKDGKVIGKLAQHNVDTGAGLERLVMVLQGKNNIFATDLFEPIITKIEELSNMKYGDKPDSEYIEEGKQCWVDVRRQMRIVADHIRTSVFMIADGVAPSNTDRGYVLRRLLRRAVRYADVLGLPQDSLAELVPIVVNKYKDIYENVAEQEEAIKLEVSKEEQKFRLTLEKGLREIAKIFSRNETIAGKEAFDLYQSYGFPIEITEELAKEKGLAVNRAEFETEMKKHQELSKSGADQKFKGGLGGTSDQIVKYHTATHLLHAALRQVLGPEVHQKGSNITDERLRFDFSWPDKLTDEQKAKVEKIVNEKIEEDLPVIRLDLPKEEAEKSDALHFFGEKYGDIVSVYYIGRTWDDAYSKEFCGGPHVDRTGVLGHFKIAKEEAVAAGVRRIKAILQ